MQQLAATQSTAPTTNAPAQPPALPPFARPTSGMNPMHSKTESTLAPTSEFTRLLLLALVSRYVLRGAIGEAFDARTFKFLKEPANQFLDRFFVGNRAKALNKILETHGEAIQSAEASGQSVNAFLHAEGKPIYEALKKDLRKWRIDASKEIPKIIEDARAAGTDIKQTYFHEAGRESNAWNRLRDHIRERMDDIGYAISLGLGGAWLSLTYSNMVRKDIKNIFSEAVAYEKGVSPDQVEFSDISNSSNVIVQRTVHNYWSKLTERLAVDALFIPAALSKSMHITDFVLGLKGAQALSETWKRKPTLFEDIVTVVNNKINPRNGLGQPITVGEVFDLYQHYSEQFAPSKMFSNVVERGTGEGAIWADSQPIFQRIAELMNLTYAYKHPSILDGDGRAIHQANFPLPKLIYMLGHDLIDTRNPAQTLATIEVANRYGMEAVKDMKAQLAQGAPLQALLAKYPVTAHETTNAAPVIETPNSITKVNHADKAAEAPLTTLSANGAELERMGHLPELAATH